ncbi:MAG: sugar phosphate isomerase/epimerase [Bacteroidetes bacterium]|nr:sugar phosphate isomerase/epimerase [Bacteroidota bacterium]MDA8217391.1 sugar phosphate isomerase/epimerase [Dehalococcoidales bacterium]
MPRYAYYPTVQLAEPIATSVTRLAKCGYQGVELPGEPDRLDPAEVRRLLDQYGMQASSVCGRFVSGRFLVHPDPAVRRHGLEYINSMSTLAAAVGAPIVVVAPAEDPARAAGSLRPEEWEWAVQGIRESAKFAAELGLKLVIEAKNRFESYLVNRLDQAVTMRDEVGLPNVGVMGDIFHMNIEETSITEAILQTGNRLWHVHLCENNRAAPGYGHIDFRAVLRALKEIGYEGYLTMELLATHYPKIPEVGREFYDLYPQAAIRHISSLWAELEPA